MGFGQNVILKLSIASETGCNNQSSLSDDKLMYYN